ncbi:hypothetical protein H9P43_004591 [Blastocladiella emersonii ATCC 22665]|nr:hypothetical protein H9P43_004591 [Blastocladiella emersonii ATCC 22665]
MDSAVSGRAGLAAATSACAHYVMSTILLHSPSLSRSTGALVTAGGPHRRRMAVIHLLLAWAFLQLGRWSRRRHIRLAHAKGLFVLPPAPWSAAVRAALLSWAHLEAAHIAGLVAALVLDPSLRSTLGRSAVLMDILPGVPCDVPDEECAICLGTVGVPNRLLPRAARGRVGESARTFSTHTGGAGSSAGVEAATGAGSWLSRVVAAVAPVPQRLPAPMMPVADDGDSMVADPIHVEDEDTAPPLPPASDSDETDDDDDDLGDTDPLDREMRVFCPTGMHACHPLCLRMYLATAVRSSAGGRLRCPTCRTPLNLNNGKPKPQPQPRRQTFLARYLASLRTLLAAYQTALGMRARWRRVARTYARHWGAALRRLLLAAACAALVTYQFRSHARLAAARATAMKGIA